MSYLSEQPLIGGTRRIMRGRVGVRATEFIDVPHITTGKARTHSRGFKDPHVSISNIALAPGIRLCFEGSCSKI
jgi:hypothetical protein